MEQPALPVPTNPSPPSHLPSPPTNGRASRGRHPHHHIHHGAPLLHWWSLHQATELLVLKMVVVVVHHGEEDGKKLW